MESAGKLDVFKGGKMDEISLHLDQPEDPKIKGHDSTGLK